MKVKLLVMPILFLLILLTACGKISDRDSQMGLSALDSQVGSSDRDPQIGSSDASFLEDDDKELSMNKLIFSVTLHYPESEKANCEYYLFVQSNGSIYTGVYSDFYAKKFEFIKQLYSFDDVDFELLDEVQHLGDLSDSETEKLCSLIENVDLGSEAYRRDESQPTPAVLDTIDYAYHCYPGNSDKTAFCIAITGNHRGATYITYDENALEALEMILNNALVTEWEKRCDKENDGSSDTSFLEEDDMALSMNKLIFSYSARYPWSEKANCQYYLFVQSDGSIYSGVYSDFYAKKYEFQKQLSSFDNVNFKLLDDVKHLGDLSDSETERLCSLIENVDLGSEAFELSETESIPTVVDTASYIFYCYPTDSKKTPFRIAIVRNWTGSSYETYDENALEALEMIRSNTLVTKWEEGCRKENDVV